MHFTHKVSDDDDDEELGFSKLHIYIPGVFSTLYSQYSLSLERKK